MIRINHKAHLGQVIGAYAAKMDADTSQDFCILLGNWNPKVQEKLYPTKLPMKIIQSCASFRSANGMHFNPLVSLPHHMVLQIQDGI